MRRTGLTPSPIVSEKAYRSLTVGSSHLVILSSLDRVPVLVVEVRQEWSPELRRPGAETRVDEKADHSLCAFRWLSRRNKLKVVGRGVRMVSLRHDV